MAAAPPFTAACVQLNVSEDIDDNLAVARDLAAEARAQGADFIAFPECASYIDMDREAQAAKADPESNHAALTAFQDMAHETGTWMLVGSLITKRPDGMLANRSYLLDPSGAVAATYDKIHMFDVDLNDGQTYRESDAYAPGDKAVLADTPWGRMGLTICYDIRFPHLYRHLAQNGADFIATPAAFTKVSGEAHWHVLQRARAIETGCFIIAPAQCGTHSQGRQTFGHSLIVNPWGDIIAEAGTEPAVITATIDPADVAAARAKIPSLSHTRHFS